MPEWILYTQARSIQEIRRGGSRACPWCGEDGFEYLPDIWKNSFSKPKQNFFNKDYVSELPQHYSVPRPEKEYVDLPKWQKLPVYLEFSDQNSHGRLLCCLHHHNLNLFIYPSTDTRLSAVSEFRKCCPWNRKRRMSDLFNIHVKVDYKCSAFLFGLKAILAAVTAPK